MGFLFLYFSARDEDDDDDPIEVLFSVVGIGRSDALFFLSLFLASVHANPLKEWMSLVADSGVWFWHRSL